jgi:predicted metalloprotease with PDZ domain
MNSVKTLTLAAAVAALALSGSAALAGDKGGKCSLSADKCCANLEEKYRTQGWLGVEKEQNEDGSWTIALVVPESPAERAGLKAGDVIHAVDGAALTKDGGAKVCTTKADKAKIGDKVAYSVRRGSETLTVQAELARIPEAVLAELKDKHKAEHATHAN